MYIERPRTAEDMKNRIQNCIAAIDAGEIGDAVDNFKKRVHLGREVNGQHFEHLF